MFNPRQYGTTQSSPIANLLHQEDLQCNESIGGHRSRPALPPKIAPTKGLRRGPPPNVTRGIGRGQSSGRGRISESVWTRWNGDTSSSPSGNKGEFTTVPPSSSPNVPVKIDAIPTPEANTAPTPRHRSLPDKPQSISPHLLAPNHHAMDSRHQKRRKVEMPSNETGNPFSCFVLSQGLSLPPPHRLALQPQSKSSQPSTSNASKLLPGNSVAEGPNRQERKLLNVPPTLQARLPAFSGRSAKGNTISPSIVPSPLTFLPKPSTRLHNLPSRPYNPPRTTSSRTSVATVERNTTLSEPSTPSMSVTRPTAPSFKYKPATSSATYLTHQVKGRVYGPARPKLVPTQGPPMSLPPKPTTWSDEPSSVPGIPQPPPRVKHPHPRPSQPSSSSSRPVRPRSFPRGRIQRPTIIKPPFSRPQPIPPPAPPIRQAPINASETEPPPPHEPLSPNSVLPQLPTSKAFAESDAVVLRQNSRELTGIPQPICPRRASIEGHIISVISVKNEETTTVLTPPDVTFPPDGLSSHPPPSLSTLVQAKLEPIDTSTYFASSSPVEALPSPSHDTTDELQKPSSPPTPLLSNPIKVKLEPTDTSSPFAEHDTLIKAESLEPHVVPMKVKQEKPDPDEVVIQRKFVTESCSFFPIPANCRKSSGPEYKENRIALFRKEYRRLQNFGLRKERVVFRDDGLVIEWSSPVPVWSDTLLPEANPS